MGRVFTVEELTYGHYPSFSSFEHATNHFMEGMGEIAQDLETEEEFSYMIHGSVGRKTETLHSDIDLLVVYPDRLALESLKRIGALRAYITKNHNVPTEANVISDREAETGFHRIRPMFGAYLREAQDTTRHIVGRPADKIVVPDGEAYETDMLDYLIIKRDGFDEAYHNYNGMDVDWHRFGRTLELTKSLNGKYHQLGQMGLRRLFVPTDEDNALRHMASRTRSLATDIIVSPNKNKDAIEAYGKFVHKNYLEAIGLAARICVNQTYEYQMALATPQPSDLDPAIHRPRARTSG